MIRVQVIDQPEKYLQIGELEYADLKLQKQGMKLRVRELIETKKTTYQTQIQQISQYLSLDVGETKYKQADKIKYQQPESGKCEPKNRKMDENFDPQQVRKYKASHGNKIKKDPEKPIFKKYIIKKSMQILLQILSDEKGIDISNIKPTINYEKILKDCRLNEKILQICENREYVKKIECRNISKRVEKMMLKFMVYLGRSGVNGWSGEETGIVGREKQVQMELQSQKLEQSQ